MPKLHGLSGKIVIQTLEKFGFLQIRQKGSHLILKRESEAGAIGCVVPLHPSIAIGTLKGILRQARISDLDFEKVMSSI